MDEFVSRAGQKLQFALERFELSVEGLICADFGSSTGGFVDCLLQNGAKKVYSVDTSYGELAWKLRNDERVVVMERTNAMHVSLQEKVDFISVDTGWTRQKTVLPNVFANLKMEGQIVSLIKPHYEAPKEYVKKGKLMEEHEKKVMEKVKVDVKQAGGEIVGMVESPILGKRGENREYLALIKKAS